ncbi:uncharacterized protein LOC133737839 [Rosa rugosa]|uniref:uncharacterized protein LOC133737839 n=1 Tax=Rosa rugosa TaxID=74645 RepID=UPI002B40D91E|nr:uncharacterized protein LOC133737839 [Rosa rugosa]
MYLVQSFRIKGSGNCCKEGAFELGCSVCPVAIKYNKIFVDAFWNSRKQSFTMHLLQLMTSWAVVCDVWYLEPENMKPGETAIEFAERVRDIISVRAGLKKVPLFQAMEYLLVCREQGGSSSPREFYNFLTKFQKASRNFAKRQLTWFRNEHIYHWFDASKPLDTVLNFICDAYHDKSGNWVVPESLQMKKELSSR